MRRYLLVLVTIAVVLSLALVGCVGQPQQPEEPPTPPSTPTTPTPYTPNPANGSKHLLGSSVKLDWTAWDPGFKPQLFKLYYATGTCTKPSTWTEVEIEKDPCCPIETTYTIQATQCGVYWWKVWACGDEASATVGPFSFCVVPGFEVTIGNQKVTVKPGNEEVTIKINACDLATDTVITIASTAATLCAETKFAAAITTPATPFFTVSPTSTTWNSGASNDPLATATLTVATETICSSLFGQTIATFTFTVFPDVVQDCATIVHCCKTEYKVNIVLEGEAPELELWSACEECAGTCECGWLVLKLPKCFSLTPATPTNYATLTIVDGNRFFEIATNDLASASPTTVKIKGNYKYYFWCLDGLDEGPGIQKIEAGKSYNIEVGQGAFKFTNNNVTFGWPCKETTFTVVAK